MKDAEVRERLTAFINEVEDCKLFPYDDAGVPLTPKGKITIGWGYNLTDNGITQAWADRLRDEKIDSTLAEVRRALPWIDGLDPVRKVALFDMAYNMGTPELLRFKRTLAAMETKKWKTAAMHAMASKWFIQTKRRAWWIVRMIAWGQWPDLSREPTKPKPADLA